jgi:ABC-type branched-subunit amino acid transport system ATPase component
MLNVRNVHAGYGSIEILHGITVHAEKSKITCIIGPNGSGKTTIFKAIFGIVHITKGNVVLRNEEITNGRPHLIVRKGISYVPQGRSLFKTMSVKENLEMGGYVLEDNETRERMRTILELFPVLKDRLNLKSALLSGGEQQMLVMARALILSPEMILLDEPSLGLEPKLTQMIMEKMKELNETGLTVMVIEQNARRALQVSDYAYVLDLGKVRFEGTGEEILNNKEVQKLYLGAV